MKLASQLFYPSTAAAESAAARREAAIRANAKKRAGYQNGFQSLPAPMTNLQPAEPTLFGDEVCLDFATLLGDESRILCGDSWREDQPLRRRLARHAHRAQPQGRQGARSRSHHRQPPLVKLPTTGGARCTTASLPHEPEPRPGVRGLPVRAARPRRADFLHRRPAGPSVEAAPAAAVHPPVLYPAYRFPVDIGAHATVSSTIYVSHIARSLLAGTDSFDTVTREWKRAGDWMLPFFGKAEQVPEELNLWFGLSPCWPYHLCAADLSALVDVQPGAPPPPPTVLHTWLDLDMPKDRSPCQLDIVNLGCGRFCVVKVFYPMDHPCGG
ncbi:hypothetical protein BS78_08G158100 [Paspalum vaginatum]|nr:hypothetical protein BS78_08G158100 [Paspalum vaginatum]